MVANPIAAFYEAQTAATAEIVRAALNGAQRIQKLTLQAMRPGTASGVAPAEQGARLQRELMQAFADMNNEIVRASYSMMERMRDALGAGAHSSIPTAPAFSFSSDADVNPMAMYDSAMRQWQTAFQQMMETPSAALAVAGAANDEGRRQKTAPARAQAASHTASKPAASNTASKSTRAHKRKSTARKR